MNQSKWVKPLRHLLLIAELLILLAILLRSQGVTAQGQAGVTLTAQAGLDGYCKDSTWIPVRVRVENTGADIEGRVQVSFQNPDGGQSTYGQDLSLPTTSRKDLFLYFFPPPYIRNLKVSLISGDKVMVESNLALSCISADNSLFGVMSENPASYEILNEVKPLTGFVRVAHLRPTDLPDRAEGWAALDALIVADVDTGTLTEAQRGSLSVWLANGGKLMMTGGPNWQGSTAGLRDFSPVHPTSIRTVSAPADLQSYFQDPNPIEGELVLAAGSVVEDATVLVEQDGIPLLVEKEVGFGKVIFLAADPSLQPLSEWEGMRTLYDSLLGTKSFRPEWVTRQWDVYSASRAVSTLNELSIPPLLSVCGWLVLYVVMIGPVNFLVLRRSKRRDLAWLTIPALAIVFSSLAYFYGSAYRGRYPVLNRIAVIQAWDNSATTDVHALVGLYSPRRAKYTLETDNQFMLYTFQGDGSNLQSGNNWFSLQDENGSVMPDVQVEIGGMESFSMQGNLTALNLDHNLVVSLKNADPVLKGTIRNTGEFVLHDAIIFTPGEWKQLGNLESGSSKDIELGLTPNANGPEFYNLDSWQIGPGYVNQIGDPGSVRREAILSAMMTSNNYYGNDGNWGIYLMGWVDQPLLPVGVQGGQFDTIDTTLYIVRLTPSIRYDSSTLKLTPGLMAWESSLPNVSPYFIDQVPAGGYVLRFRPAVRISFNSVKQLTLNINSPSANLPGEVSVSLWNFETAQWERIERFNWGIVDIPQPASYVGPGGEIRLKIDTLTNNYVQVGPASISLVVNR